MRTLISPLWHYPGWQDNLKEEYPGKTILWYTKRYPVIAIKEPITKVNLERLTNGIYAFTMTLMIRNIQSPQPGMIEGMASFTLYLQNTVLSIIDFIGVFLILGMFWLFYFQIFHRMRTFDYRFLYIHLFSLMIVVFVPFTQSFSVISPDIPIAELPFQLNYLALSILLVLAWHYTRTHPSLLVPDMTNVEASFLSKKPDEPGWFRQNKMKVGLPTFMLNS